MGASLCGARRCSASHMGVPGDVCRTQQGAFRCWRRKELSSARGARGGLGVPAGVHARPLCLTLPAALDYCILFLKNLNTFYLKTENRALRTTPALLSGAAEASSFSICHWPSTDTRSNEGGGRGANCTRKPGPHSCARGRRLARFQTRPENHGGCKTCMFARSTSYQYDLALRSGRNLRFP